MYWWEFGEHSGYHGDKLTLHRITCGFCGESGNFETVGHLDKKNASTGKVLNYDTIKCGGCGNYTMVFWSAARSASGGGNHDFKTVPWPREITRYPDHWPPDIGRYWLQAQRSLDGKNWDAASLMARSAIQLVVRNQNATGRNLKEEIDDLSKRGLLPPIMREWSHEVRELGNDSAHPSPGEAGPEPKDAKAVVDFLGVLLNMVYDLPHQISDYRARKKP